MLTKELREAIQGSGEQCCEPPKTMNPNDPAFPVATELGPEVNYSNAGSTREIRSSVGISLRAYIATHIAAGMEAVPDDRTCPKDKEFEEWRMELAAIDAHFCVMKADALIAELNKEAESTKLEL